MTTSSGFFHDVKLIAGFDLRESMRTRRAVVLIGLYLAAATISAYTYVRVVAGLERTAAEALSKAAEGSLAKSQVAGALVVEMARSSGYRKLLDFVAGGDRALADHLASFPPMVLIFTWCALAFLPWLIALTSYDQVAGDLHLRTVRYVALRTSRAAFVMGKLVSQLVLIAAVSLVATLPVVAFGAAYLTSFDLLATVRALAMTWPLTVAYAIAFLGAASLASQLARTPGAARALALGLLFLLWLASLARAGAKVSTVWAVLAPVGWISPWAYKAGFFRPELSAQLASVAACVGLGAAYVGLGFLRFRRRDL